MMLATLLSHIHQISVIMPPIFFFNDTATTEIYTLSLHDALPIYSGLGCPCWSSRYGQPRHRRRCHRANRSEEHTSELQSQSNLVCRLLLEKKRKNYSDSSYP